MTPHLPRIAALCTLGLVVAGTGTATAAVDVNAGQELHAANCTSCHDSGVYTRQNRRVNSLDTLRKQVRRCERAQGLRWFDDQLESVVQYLNQTYYRFE